MYFPRQPKPYLLKWKSSSSHKGTKEKLGQRSLYSEHILREKAALDRVETKTYGLSIFAQCHPELLQLLSPFSQ